MTQKLELKKLKILLLIFSFKNRLQDDYFKKKKSVLKISNLVEKKYAGDQLL